MARIIILGVNPFEDLPGYQLLSLLMSEGSHKLLAVDDSKVALQVLKQTGACIEYISHPSENMDKYIMRIIDICKSYRADLLLPSTDAHISALSQSLDRYPLLGKLYPPLKWLASKKIYNKYHMQQLITDYLRTPEHWSFLNEGAINIWEERNIYPVMVKGMRKGAIKCNDSIEAIVARRTIMKNPANKVLGGGVYLESYIRGEEHSLFLLIGNTGQIYTTFGFRKLAKTQLGTTLCGQVDYNLPFKDILSKLSTEIQGPMILEIEWRLDDSGKYWVFEVNHRFPSWIGALGKFGLGMIDTYIALVLEPDKQPPPISPRPLTGSLFYRLPESGYLPLPLVFGNSQSRVEKIKTGRIGTISPLWRGCSPHQFMIK